MKTLASLQVYRAFAALAVLAYHASAICRSYERGDTGIASRVGLAGVVFFFALSGFIMGWVHEKDFGRKERAGTFFRKRFLRIYPVYWIVLLAFLPLWLWLPGFGVPRLREASALIGSVLLAPQSGELHLMVAWTLSHEILFYLVFAALLFSRRAGAALMAGWTLAILAGATFADALGSPDFPARFFLSPLNLLFPAGMLTAFAARRLATLKGAGGVALFALGNGLFVWGLSSAGEASSWNDAIVFGAASVLVLAGATAPRVEALVAPRKALLYLGAASYSLYLVHDPAMRVFGRALSAAGLIDRLPLSAAFVAFAGFGLASGLALHRFVEAPLLAYFGRRFGTLGRSER